MRYFETIFSNEVEKFIEELDAKEAKKILYNIDLAEQTNDPKLFKKLENEIWEFRTLYNKSQIRLFAFWDKTKSIKTLVIVTHGLIKKTDKIPKKEIEKANDIRIKYFENKTRKEK
ncbi:type II toxin-antitoxin system RelE/ParE family toxin [Odoribacter sp. OttesenSCG-928-L07]|nr:type II toxin-antitoxin system RelE/ParE family toxin [Odoribacter sp. OttesenSCG-928-L07]MDL2238940.1 type II toxin-antitoxin system RelE/ParE family toxin [Bacteroidales bacterium OttesenSCG-928-L14]